MPSLGRMFHQFRGFKADKTGSLGGQNIVGKELTR